MFSNFHVLILAGGRGIRLWPKSNKKFPKHTLSLNFRYSLLQNTYKRLQGFIPEENIFVITLEEQAKKIKKQLPSLHKENLIIEPEGKNTLPAILLGTIWIKRRFPQAIIAVLPSDHFIKPKRNFLNVLRKAKEVVERKDCILTLGIKPNYPNTDYGYIKIKSKIKELAQHGKEELEIYKVEKFIEKPSLERAIIFSKDKKFFWNLGIFVFGADKILKETEEFSPLVYKEFSYLAKFANQKKFNLLLKCIYKKVTSISIDKAIIEKSPSVYMLKANFSWLDLGSWESLASVLRKDRTGNVCLGENFLYKTKDSIIINEDKGHLVATLGLDNLIIIHTPDVSLICPKFKTKDLRKMVHLLERNQRIREYI
ncbi:MAG: sugar phosphate nucleotidyltransferase [Candidatus Omnitrophica bacterium]|nr:sugar phosphate nucleotidyltransferase [Candidatus Omnitrophota bacterium]